MRKQDARTRHYCPFLRDPFAAEDCVPSRMLSRATVGVWVIDAEGRTLYANEAMAAMLRVSNEELSRARVWDFTDDAGRESGMSQLSRRREGISEKHEFVFHRPDGSTLSASLVTFPLLDQEQGFEAAVAFVEDVEERKTTESELRDSKAHLERAQRISRTGSWEFHLDTGRVVTSSMARDIYGIGGRDWTIEEVQAVPLPEYRAALDEALRALVEEGTPYKQTFRISRPSDGATVDIQSVAEYDAERRVVMGTLRDITKEMEARREREAFEAGVRQTQKLESLGVLAGGIAHDFNNILVGVLGNAELALAELGKLSPAVPYLKSIRDAATRASELSRQMLAYTGRESFEKELLDLNELISDTLQMVEVSLPKSVVMRLDLADSLPPVLADATQLRQVLMNLVINGAEAIGERSGVVAIRTGSMDCDEGYLRSTLPLDLVEPGEYVYLEVSDTGEGMDSAARERLFEPFFTTKFTGRGLGLSAVLGIVRGHSGTIKVYSEPGSGSTFKVLFPSASATAQGVVSEEDGEPEETVLEGAVLLVDDDETVRTVGKRLLSHLGIETILAEDGRDALRIFASRRSEIGLVLLDLTMPHLDGEQTLRELRIVDRQVPVVIMSGYAEQELRGRFAGRAVQAFLQKPFQLKTLRRVLEEIRSGGGA